jgi:acyl-CoA synthetase (AMP-forming)/AMP-acid ligase II
MQGYWQNAEATDAAFRDGRDGWFKTGDVARRDGDGYYWILGRRSSDIIKSGGFKVGAREIEDVLLAHPSVREASVVGLPDARWGEVVAAAVVADMAHDVVAAELIAWCGERLADFKRPRRVIALAALPRNAMGKVMKSALRGLFS